MNFVHGSKNLINLDLGFILFDYNYCLIEEEANNKFINSGLDVEGIGIYCLNGYTEENISNSISYASNDGYSYILSIDDFNEEDFLNYREPDEIPIERWIEAIESFIDDVRNQKGFNFDYFEDMLRNIESFQINSNKWSEKNKLDHNEINKILKSNGLSFVVDDELSQHSFNNFDDWIDAMRETFYMEEPFSNIFETDTIESLLEYSIDRSDNLWDTLKNVGESFATISRGNSFDCYNKTFHKRISHHLEDYKLKAGLANNDRFVVIFDVDSINIEKVIDHKLERTKKEQLNKKTKATI